MLDVCSNFGRSLVSALGSFAFRAILALAVCLGSTVALAQSRIDLDDMNIKGELINDNRLRLSSREQNKISDRISYRNNFRKEVTDGLETTWPDEGGGPRGPASATDGGAQ